MRAEIKAGRLNGHELWIFTDNWVAESCFAKGSSSSPVLCELVLDLHEMVMFKDIHIHMVHVAGTRIIELGFDGLSRGDFDAGIMTGDRLLDHIPLHLGALQREPKLSEWLHSWMGDEFCGKALEPTDWFRKGHQAGVHVWAPPPVVALAALEELSMSKLKRPYELTHVVLIPRIMFNVWRRRFLKEVDFHFELPVGTVWATHQHEPLIVGCSFPLSKHRPWKLGRSAALVGAQRTLQSMRKKDDLGYGDRLRELWDFTRKIPGLSSSVVWKMLQSSPIRQVPHNGACRLGGSPDENKRDRKESV